MTEPNSDPRVQLQELLAQGRELAAKGTRSTDELKQMTAILTKAGELRASIEQNDKLDEYEKWGQSSQGRIPVAAPGARSAGGANLENITPAGSMTITNDPDKDQFNLSENYGEGLFSERQLGMTRTDEYRKAFRTWIRTPVGSREDQESVKHLAAVRALQEGSESEGGLAAA